MALKTIKYLKQGEDYIAYIGKYEVCVDIIRIHEYNPLGTPKVRYRVDFKGRTRSSSLTLAEAKKVVNEILKPYR